MTQKDIIQKHLDENKEMIERIPLEDKQEWKEGTRAVIEANLWKFDEGTYFLGQTATRIINHVEALLKEERNAVLSEVEKSFENLHEEYTVDYTNHDILKIINNLRVK